jgi:hypothetical protein
MRVMLARRDPRHKLSDNRTPTDHVACCDASTFPHFGARRSWYP